MKNNVLGKLSLIFTLVIIIAAFLIAIPFSVSADISSEKYYIANENIDLFENINDSESIIFIPKTYYFKKVGDTDSEFIEVSYNDQKYYIKSEDFSSKSKLTTYTTIEKPSYSIENIDKTKITSIVPKNKLSTNSFVHLTIEELNNAKFIGVKVYNNEPYFYFYLELTEDSYYKSGFYYVKATDIVENYDVTKISVHANSSNVATTDKPKEDKPIAQNNLLKYILIGIVCTLCILIVFLIYLPGIKIASNNKSYNNRDDDIY